MTFDGQWRDNMGANFDHVNYEPFKIEIKRMRRPRSMERLSALPYAAAYHDDYSSLKKINYKRFSALNHGKRNGPAIFNPNWRQKSSSFKLKRFVCFPAR